MSGTLISRIATLAGAVYGVNLLTNEPPQVVTGVSTNVLAIVGEFPWGPQDEVTQYNTVSEAMAAIYPSGFGAPDTTTYPAMKAFLNKRFPRGFKLVRVGATSSAAAAKTFDDAASGDSVVVTARYKGTLGNSIQIAWSANADTSANRDMTVSIGTTYSKLYKNVVSDAGSSLTVVDPGDPYVSVAAAVGSTEVPAVAAAAALTGGSDGTAVAGDYVGSDVSAKGIRLLYGDSEQVDVLFVAECPSGLLNSVNAGLKAYADDTLKGLAILCTVNNQAASAVLSYVATYENSRGRTVYCWPRVNTTDSFDPDRAEVECDGNAFAAVAICNVEPWLSPGGKSGAFFLEGITDLETSSTTKATLETLREGGIACWFQDRTLGTIIAGAMATDGSKLRRTRTQDWIGNSLAAYLVNYAEKPLDLNLATEVLGNTTLAEISAIKSWLQEQKDLGRIKAFSVDPWSGNTEGDIDLGIWVIGILVELFSDQDKIVISLTAGETVSVS